MAIIGPLIAHSIQFLSKDAFIGKFLGFFYTQPPPFLPPAELSVSHTGFPLSAEEQRKGLLQLVGKDATLGREVADLRRQVEDQEAALSCRRGEDASLWQEVADLRRRVAYHEGQLGRSNTSLVLLVSMRPRDPGSEESYP